MVHSWWLRHPKQDAPVDFALLSMQLRGKSRSSKIATSPESPYGTKGSKGIHQAMAVWGQLGTHRFAVLDAGGRVGVATQEMCGTLRGLPFVTVPARSASGLVKTIEPFSECCVECSIFSCARPRDGRNIN